MQTISWWDAWALWFSGQEVPGEAYMGPFTILAWGRIGKVLGFFSAAFAIIDLIGSRRLREWLVRNRPPGRLVLARELAEVRGNGSWVPLSFGAAYLASRIDYRQPMLESVQDVGIIIAASTFSFLLPVYGLMVISFLARMLEREIATGFGRGVAYVLLLLGFHLDLLAS